jgi:protein-disulfide isomerase
MQNRSLVAPALLLAAAAAGCAPTQAQAPDAGTQPAAQIGESRISLEEVDKKAAGSLARIDYERYEARRRALEEMVSERLVDEAARARGVSRDALLKAEVQDKVPAPTEQEMRATFERHKAQLGGMTYEQVAERIRRSLHEQALAVRTADFQESLRKDTPVRILLEAPRAEVSVPADAPSQGPKDAKVTIVEFLDYQCPFCHRAQESVDQILKEYQGRIRFVHRDYVLGKPRSLPAARAARCAGEQGKFWEYHRGLLVQPGDMSDADLLNRAKTLALDPARFAACAATDRFDADIHGATQAGDELGVSGTPTFFINGRRLVGAVPAWKFKEVIDAEIRARG